MPEPTNPTEGGSYTRDPVTGDLQKTEQTGPATGRLRRHADDKAPATAGAEGTADATTGATDNPQPEA